MPLTSCGYKEPMNNSPPAEQAPELAGAPAPLFFSLRRGADVSTRGDRRRLTALASGVLALHLAVLAIIVWIERTRPPAEATATQEIPVEVATEEEAGGSGPSGAAPQPGEGETPGARTGEARAEPPAQTAAASQSDAGETASQPQTGQIVERPGESDKPQAARTRGADGKPADQEPRQNPFGGLSPVAKPPDAEPTPAFLSSQNFTTRRPKPAEDPTNDNYRAKVLGKVAAAMIDPERPRPKALAIVGFRLGDQGAIESVWLARPTGMPDLDQEAMEMVRRAAPFPPPPPKADRNFGAAIAFGGE